MTLFIVSNGAFSSRPPPPAPPACRRCMSAPRHCAQLLLLLLLLLLLPTLCSPDLPETANQHVSLGVLYEPGVT